MIKCIKHVQGAIKNRYKKLFITSAIKSELVRLKEQGYEEECNSFMKDVGILYSSCLEYLSKWTDEFQELEVLNWMGLLENSTWDDVQRCILYLESKGLKVDEGKLFDEFTNLESFVKTEKTKDYFKQLMVHERWVHYFKACEQNFPNELLKVCQFYFAIMPHNANVERVFFMMQVQWTDERDALLVESVASIVNVQYNWKTVNCRDFYDICKNDILLLNKVRSSAKY